MPRNAKPKGKSMRLKELCRRRIRIVYLALCLLPLLNGCASEPIIVTKVERERVPESLLVPCSKSQLEANPTYESAINLAEARGRDVDECNARLADIRKWSGG